MSDTFDTALPCPFCGKPPEQYVIGARPLFNEKGHKMVRCKSNGGCAIYGHAIHFDQWQRREEKP